METSMNETVCEASHDHGSPNRNVRFHGVRETIAAIDLSMVKLKLQDREHGLAWTTAQCESAELEYKRYLELCKRHGPGIVPNAIMDDMWHFHILDTRAYARDCEVVFGHFLHHFPYFGMRGDDDRANLLAAFARTQALYEQAFGEPMARAEHTDCWHDCANRCWHACSDDS
jgi:hypothetical protein